MKDLIRSLSHNYREGMLTDREYLAQLLQLVGELWTGSGDTGNADAAWLAQQLSELPEPKAEPKVQYEKNGYLLSIFQSDIKGEACYLIKAEPVHPFGYMFYAYKTFSQAEEVIYNLRAGDFDEQVYRVNFNPSNGKFFVEDRLPRK